MFSGTFMLTILIVLASTAFVNFAVKPKAVSQEMTGVANKFIMTYNAFVGIILIGAIVIGLIDGSLIEYFRTDDNAWRQIFSIGGSTIAFVFIATTAKYKLTMENAYKNDERWQSIVTTVNKKLYNYHVFLIGVTVCVMITGTIWAGDGSFYVNFEMMLMAIFVILASRDVVELFLLRKYDKSF